MTITEFLEKIESLPKLRKSQIKKSLAKKKIDYDYLTEVQFLPTHCAIITILHLHLFHHAKSDNSYYFDGRGLGLRDRDIFSISKAFNGKQCHLRQRIFKALGLKYNLEEIKESLYILLYDKRKAYDRYQKTIAKIDKQISNLRKICDHPTNRLSFDSDPSGNNDSTLTCGVCGKIL